MGGFACPCAKPCHSLKLFGSGAQSRTCFRSSRSWMSTAWPRARGSCRRSKVDWNNCAPFPAARLLFIPRLGGCFWVVRDLRSSSRWKRADSSSMRSSTWRKTPRASRKRCSVCWLCADEGPSLSTPSRARPKAAQRVAACPSSAATCRNSAPWESGTWRSAVVNPRNRYSRP